MSRDDYTVIHGALAMLRALSEAREGMLKLAIRLRQRHGVLGVSTIVDCRQYRGDEAPTVELYVDAELSDQTAIGWLVDVSWSEEMWRIEYSVRHNTTQGQTVIQEFAPRVATTLEGFAEGLAAVVGELDASADALCERVVGSAC